MQKSMVQELSSLAASYIFANRQSQISTYISDNEYSELRKSRIHNLPGHKKQDLSAKLNFVVVFQTIQIERLSQEIEKLRVQAKDSDHQKQNYNSYEIQIKELTERCHMLEMQLSETVQEKDKINIFCQNIYQQFQEYRIKFGEGQAGLNKKYQLQRDRNEQLQSQIAKWRNRVANLQISKGKEIEQIRKQQESMAKDTISRQVKDSIIKYEFQINNLKVEFQKNQEEGDQTKNQMVKLQYIVDELKYREQEFMDIQDRLEQHQNRFVLLSQQNYRLNEVIRMKTQQLKKQKSIQTQLRQNIQEIGSLQQISSLKKQIEDKTRQIAQLKEFSTHTLRQNQKLRIYSIKAAQYQQLVQIYQRQINNLHQISRDKIQELEQFKNKSRIYEERLISITNVTQRQFAVYQDKILSFTKELERISIHLADANTENQQLNQRCEALQNNIERYQAIEEENAQLRQQLTFHIQKAQEFKNKTIVIEERLKDTETFLYNEEQIKNRLIEEREGFSQNLKELQAKIQMYAKKNNYLQSEIQKLAHVRQQLLQSRLAIQSFSQQLGRLKLQIQIRVSQLSQLKQTVNNLSLSKTTYQDIEMKLVSNLQEMEGLILQLDKVKRENQYLQDNNMNLKIMVKKLQAEAVVYEQEKEEMIVMIRQRTGQIHQLQMQIEENQSQSQAVNELRIRLTEYQKQFDKIQLNRNQMEGLYEDQKQKVEHYSEQINKLTLQLMKLQQQSQLSVALKEQIYKIRYQCEQKQLLISQLKARIESIQDILYKLKQEYSKSFDMSYNLSKRLQQSLKKMDFVDIITIMENYTKSDSITDQINQEVNRNQDFTDVEKTQSIIITKINNINQNSQHQKQIKQKSQLVQTRYLDSNILKKSSAQSTPTNSDISVKTSVQHPKNMEDPKVQNQNKRSSVNIHRGEQTIIRAGSIYPIHKNILQVSSIQKASSSVNVSPYYNCTVNGQSIYKSYDSPSKSRYAVAASNNTSRFGQTIRIPVDHSMVKKLHS